MNEKPLLPSQGYRSIRLVFVFTRQRRVDGDSGCLVGVCAIGWLPKELSCHWEKQQEEWEETLQAAETVPDEAAVLATSLNGVMMPMKDAGRAEKRSQHDKQASEPAGFREVECGTVVLYAANGKRLSTVRYGRMPEYKKATLCRQLEAECQSILALRPDLKVVKLADGAEENWRFPDNLDLGLPPRLLADYVRQVSPPCPLFGIVSPPIWHDSAH